MAAKVFGTIWRQVRGHNLGWGWDVLLTSSGWRPEIQLNDAQESTTTTTIPQKKNYPAQADNSGEVKKC